MSRGDRPKGLRRRIIRVTAWTIRARVTRGSLVAIFNTDRTLLLVRSRTQDSRHWGLPGGFTRSKETHSQTARREVREETGLDIEIQPKDEVAHYIQPWAWHLDVLFRINLSVSPPKIVHGPEILEAQWCDISDPSVQPRLTPEATLALAILRDEGRWNGEELPFFYYYR